MPSQRIAALIVAWSAALWLWGAGIAPAQSTDVFLGFTGHIERQIHQDKQFFVDAQTCTEWFYKQQSQPDRPKSEGIGFSGRRPEVLPAIHASDCPGRYPGGLNAAREDFSSTQSALSISLTFYEFALVGDRDDDRLYNAGELRDVLESFELTYDRNRPDSVHLMILTDTFDTLRKTGGLERLMTGMGTLFEKGYRLSERDRSTLDQITK